ncbi:MAG: DUF4230 domain-containing protein [Chloroflexota bacterium]|nr:DUF4230 domain-containing protein [Chloroflexota bacterium]
MKGNGLSRLLVVLLLLIIVGVGVWQLWSKADLFKQTSIDMPISLRPQITPTIYPSKVTVIESIQILSRLETISYAVEKVITAESGQGALGFLFGDRLLLIAYGEVIAGIDLGKIDINDVMRGADGTLYMRLPAPEIFIATLDNERTQVYDRSTGLVGLNEQLETEARQAAEHHILEAALERGILEQAEENSRHILRSLILSMGFEHVAFVEVLPTPTPTPTLTPTPSPTPE